MKKLLPVILILLIAMLAFTACNDPGSDPGNNPGNPPQNAPVNPPDGNDPSLKNFENISFQNASFTYNNTEHKIEVSGTLPEGARVSYTNNKATNAGVYNATAKLECDGYNTKTLIATLTVNKATYNMSNAEWSYSSAFTYDGDEKTVTLSGLPAGVSIKSYSNNAKTNAGSYTASAVFNYDTANYNAPTVSPCTWVINKADITATVTMNGGIVEYDTFEHSLEIVGDIPAGTTVKYYYNNIETGYAIDPGTYAVRAVISGPNHNELVINASLVILPSEELLYVANLNGVIYFQNNLDDNKLYKTTSSGVVKVNNDKPEYFFTYGNELYYYSSSLFSKSIKKINSAGFVSSVFSVDGEYLTSDGTYVYYAINNLIFNTDENGIYKYKLDGSEAEPVRICTAKAAYLTVYDGFVYFSNLSADKKLYKVSVNGGTPALIHDEKVEYIIEDNGVLYFDSSTAFASAIYKYNIASATATKMTTDSGKYLAKLGNDIYYVNNDRLTSTIFGDGIYKISALASGSLPGNKILSADAKDGFSSITSDGTYLYFYKLSDKHLYKYNPSSNSLVDLMAGFTPPEDTSPLVGNTVIAEYRGEIYYTNPKDGILNGACLYKYNPTTGTRVKVLQDDVAGVWFNGDLMYYSTCIATNYALFCKNMRTGETTKINSDRCENLIFEGNDIYYIKVSVTGNNAIMKMNATDLTALPTLIYNAENLSVTGMYKYGNTFYFVKNPKIGYQYLFTYTIGESADGESLGIKGKRIVISGDRIYYFDDNDDVIKSCNLTGGDVKTLVQNVVVNDMYISGNKLYYSSTKSATKGFYCYDISAKTNVKISSSVAQAITVVGDNVWFVQTAVIYEVDYPIHTAGGDGMLYCYNGTTVTKK